MRFDMSPRPPSASISSASSSTNMRMPVGSHTRICKSVQIFPGVPMMIWSVIESPRSYRSSRSTVFTESPASIKRYFPIRSTSSEICFASSRVGPMHSACGTLSDETTLSIPSTKHAVLPVPLCDWASRLRPAQIFGSEAAWIFDGRTKLISYSPLSRAGGSASSGESKLLHVTECSLSSGAVLSITWSVAFSASCVISSGSSISVSCASMPEERAAVRPSTASAVELNSEVERLAIKVRRGRG
mmetsp:Transcript_3364/g.8085  ORF Transcript_3364/g.8085 Transcript_3364/m.8085 type:complete len:244 (+) Transcript_3364:870-1601(+)